uniref:Envelope polyprotein n=1 Tax=Macaca mulatta TaxID=9544 RepID=A0A5F8AS16_MACMU
MLDNTHDRKLSSKYLFTYDGRSDPLKYHLNIKDPWDSRWVDGVKGGLYGNSIWDSYPTATLLIKRTLVQQKSLPKNIQVLQNLTSVIISQEQNLQEQLNPPNKKDPFSWLKLVRQGLNLTQTANITNLSHCFLCAALERAPLVAVPLPAAFKATTDSTSTPQKLSLLQVSLYQNPENPILPFCYSAPNSSWCNYTQSPNRTQTAPVGGYFWCNQTLSKILNHTSISQFLCIPVSLVPSLTLYTKGEVFELTSQLTTSNNKIQKRATFLPMVIGVSLASSLIASGLGTRVLAHSVQSMRTLFTQVQEAIEASAESLASLQCQITSIAQVSAQNRRALDLLTAEKGGTCLFLGEECCYYINESGLVDTNVQTLNKIKKELQNLTPP